MGGGEPLTGTLIQSFQVSKVIEDGNEITGIDWNDKGTLMLTCTENEIRVYDIKTGTKKYGCAHALFTHSKNNLIHASTSERENDAIRYMSMHDYSYISYFEGHTQKVVSLALSPVGDSFISASLDNTVRMWDLKDRNASGIINLDRMTNPLLAYDPSGRVFALALNDSVIKLYATSNQGAGPFLSKHISDPSIYPPPRWTKISFSADGKYILISTNAGVLYLVDAFEVDILHKLTGHLNSEGIAFQGCFTPDAKYVMCGSQDGKVHFWDVATGTRMSENTGLQSTPRIVSFAPTSLLYASVDTNLSLWLPRKS